MKILDRYIAYYIICSTLFVLLVFLGIEMMIDFANQLSTIGEVHYGVIQSLSYVLLNLPSNSYQLFPMVGLVGSLLGLGHLASTNQLVVMQVSGISTARLTWSVIRITLFLLIFITFLGEYVGPLARNYAENYKALSLNQQTGLNTFKGVWLHKENDFIHIEAFKSPKEIEDITLYSFNKNGRLTSLYRANRGVLEENQWVLSNAIRTTFNEDSINTIKAPSQKLDLDIQPELLALSIRDPYTITLIQMHRYINYLHETNLNASSIEFNFWQRIIQPLTTIVMIILSVPFILGSLREAGAGLRMLIGIVIGFSFYILNQIFGPVSLLFDFPPYLAAITPSVLVLLFCFFLHQRLKR